ncbi:30S ribosomal protein S13 [Aliifodinibius salicampi]|uniref:Small ribosomal subunit protein uS13 n=1 Tax=Fodinibius salicampi TaxID=1920655 RepID=A0ABT3Q388_9BACT|nr:30S ribosomal protein S13 [Fodinibius salicampi]MCW9714568.1 30S ribosomal protein S13 [Fodinibius salicampi]
MARIAGIDLPKEKRGEVGLTYIFGIGRSTAQEILDELEIDYDTKVKDWTDDQVTKLRTKIDNEYTVEGNLRSEVKANIRRLIEIGSYRGTRHRKGLPVRGQNTQTNARTRKGKRRTVAGRKSAPKK